MFLNFIFLAASSQDVEALKKKLDLAKTQEEKLPILDSLARMYFKYGNDSVAKIYSAQQLSIANNSNDIKLKAETLFKNGDSRLENPGRLSPQRFEESIDFFNRTVVYARQNNLPDYEANAYIKLSTIYRTSFSIDINKSIEYANLAQNIAGLTDNDSLKILSMIALGSGYNYKKNRLTAFRYFSNALHLSEKLNNDALKKSIFNSFSEFYSSLNDYQKSIEYLLKVLDLDQQKKPVNHRDIFGDYLRLGMTYAAQHETGLAEEYYYKSYNYGKQDKLNENFLMTPLARLHTLYTYANQFDKAKAIDLAHPELLKAIIKNKIEFIRYGNNAYYYMSTQQWDSAEYFWKKAETHPNASPSDVWGALLRHGQLKMKQKKYDESIQIFEKAKATAILTENIDLIKSSYHYLDSACFLKGDFTNAYRNRAAYDIYNDSLQQLNKEKELSILEIENENQRLVQVQKEEQERIRRRHNLQYMGITACIATVFILLVLFGVFSSSTTVIRGFGFFAFILFFEFIILLSDNIIHGWTHGEPWKVLAIKIGLIAILFPLHHYIEVKVVHHLIHRKKLQLRPGSFRKKGPVKTDTDS